jgi:hypothetical protein
MAEEEKTDELKDVEPQEVHEDIKFEQKKESTTGITAQEDREWREKTSKVIVHSGDYMPPADITMTQVLAMLVHQGGDVEVIKTMVALKKELDADEAKKAFYKAFAKVQKEIKPVLETKRNTQTQSNYAPLEGMNAMIMPIAAKHGFSMTFNQGESTKEGYLRILGELAHNAGHLKDDYFVDLPIDEKGLKGNVNKTLIHATSSTFSYGQKYLVKLMFNLSTIGEDDDGNAAGGKVADDTITEEQAKELNTLIGENSGLLKTVLETYNAQYPVEFLADLKSKDFQNCKNRIAKYNEGHK